ETINLNMEEQLEEFLSFLPENAEVLDLGCGSGRDSRFLEEAGCYVTPMDGSPKMCSLAEIYTDMEVLCLTYEEMEFQEVFDGIWASASLLHVARKDMPKILEKLYHALKPGGILYMSFQYGETEEYRNQRFYCDYTERTMKSLLKYQRGLELLELYQSDDMREGRNRWLNVLVKKEGGEEDE
ncbi:MAG: methyltransferase domain-containing protein, partial [Oscillospiraceae bacterium]|nr:methyltransferase domain-containing protein [Oscillospiraceae bacterium]